MKHTILSPDFENEETKSLARIIKYTAIGIILISFIFLFTVPIIAPSMLSRALLLAGIAIPAGVVSVILVRRRKVQQAGIFFTAVIWVIVSMASLSAGGVSAPIFIGYILVITFGVLVNRKSAVPITLLCIAASIAISYLEVHRLLPAAVEYTPYGRVSIYIFFFVAILILQSVNSTNWQSLIEKSKKDEFRFRSLLENIPATTYINTTDADSKTTYVSPQAENLLGYPREAFLDDPLFWTKIIHPDDVERVTQESVRTSKTQDPFETEYRLIAKNGRVVWVKDKATLVFDADGRPIYWLGVWTDITSQKQIEEEQADLISAMTRRTIQLQTAADVARAATSILDIDELMPNVVELIRNHFDYYYVGIFLNDTENQRAVLRAGSGEMGTKMMLTGHQLKVDESSMIGWCIANREARIALDVGEDAVRFANPLLPLTRSEMALPLIAHGDVIGAMTIQSEQPAAFSSVDIIALQAMADLVANAIENARLFTERVTLTRELEEQNEELERFSYTVSHDLRSPLVTIRGFLGYLRQDAESGDLERFDKDMTRIANAVDKMQTLLNELLELSRVGRITNPPETINFGEVVQESLDLLSGQLEAGGVKVKVADTFPLIHADKIRIYEVIQNLITNAIKFMGNQKVPQIEIGTHGVDLDGKPIFFVGDNGIGIEPQYHDRIFGLFNRLDPSIEGTGIGLTLVKRIVDIHGGRIWIESKFGQGAVFYFTLPSPATSDLLIN